ncbi:hypothetical protein FO519_006712 [Halicephalobus sp. NKZ332]|nr:hypothetical protein FO519_006712 [Halicephalobus sp. NKZ332]
MADVVRRQCPTAKCPQQLSCPCRKPANSTKCFSYDTTLQATSIDEAIFSFPDFSDPSPTRSTMVNGSHGSSHMADTMKIQAFAGPQTMAAPADSDLSCDSGDCAGCKHWVIEGFAKSLNTSVKNGKRQGQDQFKCPYLEQKEQQKVQQTVTQNQQHDEVANQLINVLQKAGQKKRKRDVNTNSVDGETSVDQEDLKDKLLGISTTISCDYQRGQALTSGSLWCGLCNICWTWRKLPPEYFPGYLNEVSCDTDNECLAGFGRCRPVLRTLTVLKNTAGKGNPENWEQQSINSVAACECQVEAGTPLHSFITK